MRQLRQCDPPIGVYFEKENIDTLDASGELLLTILSALAQEESNSISKNISWSIQKRFQEGIAFGNPRSVYGYTDGETNKDWIIVEEQARVVRFIFDEFLLGKSSYKISNELNEKGIPSSKGTKWQSESVDFILRNEKYVGDCELQKTVTVDFLRHKTIPNNGEAPKFYVTDHHVPIINRAVWMRAQEILAHRKKNRTKKRMRSGKNEWARMSLITWYAENAEPPFTAEPCRQEPRTSRMTGAWMPAAVSCWHRGVRRMITMNGIITPIPFGGAQV